MKTLKRYGILKVTQEGLPLSTNTRPTAKKTAQKTIKKAAKYVGKSFASGLAEDLSYGGVYEFTLWYTNALISKSITE